MKNFLIIGSVALMLSGCGGSNRYPPAPRAPAPAPVPAYGSVPPTAAPVYAAPRASGPISRACLSSDRSARSGALCGCIQAVANQTLSSADQNRAVGFYSNPHQAQEVRQSDRASDERFWEAYRAYGERAEQVCS